jgi:hypothetical protein
MLAPLVDPNPMPSTHNNNIYAKEKSYIQNEGAAPNPLER